LKKKVEQKRAGLQSELRGVANESKGKVATHRQRKKTTGQQARVETALRGEEKALKEMEVDLRLKNSAKGTLRKSGKRGKKQANLGKKISKELPIK